MTNFHIFIMAPKLRLRLLLSTLTRYSYGSELIVY